MNLDSSNRTQAKLEHLKAYFRDTPAADAAWAVFFLSGNRLKRAVKLKDLKEWAGEACGYPAWMVEACYDQVGDLAETLALLLGNLQPTASADGPALHHVVDHWITPLSDLEAAEQKQQLLQIWRQMDSDSCFIFNKLITGGFRVGVSQTLVHRALAELADVEPAVMAHRLMGKWQPGPAAYHALFDDSDLHRDPARPYPFCLAYALEQMEMEQMESKLGAVDDWQFEWKWDGIRAQLIKRAGAIILWSRGEEMVNEQFPEIIEAAAHLPDGLVLDGELLAWDRDQDRVATFSKLQKRLGRKRIGSKLKQDVPVKFMAYDLLELDGRDQRNQSTAQRREALHHCLDSYGGFDPHIGLSEVHQPESWAEVIRLRADARERGVEGLMLKAKSSEYLAGRKKGAWWKWKVDPFTADAVLVYAQQGHGRRAGLYTDYTFSVWNEAGELTPFAKAYSGLTNAEIREVDRWIRANTLDKHGPVRVVKPELVFELAFEGISQSKRHKSGIAVRFPRIHRWRRDKPAKEADTLSQIQALLPQE